MLARLRGLGTILALLALLLQTGVPLAHQPLVMGSFAPGLGMPMCHVATGAASDKSGGATPSAPGKIAYCPICLGLLADASGCLPNAVAAGLALAPPEVVALRLPPGKVGRTRERAYASQPRAPPALA
jgi:hypothetical protein